MGLCSARGAQGGMKLGQHTAGHEAGEGWEKGKEELSPLVGSRLAGGWVGSSVLGMWSCPSCGPQEGVQRPRAENCCSGEISAIAFSGVWTTVWDANVQFFSLFPSKLVFLSSLMCVCIPYCAVLFHVVVASCLYFCLGCYEISYGSVLIFFLLKISKDQRPLLYVMCCWVSLSPSGLGLF